MQHVSVGRVVHYREGNVGPCLAAIVAKVHNVDDGFVNLSYFTELGVAVGVQGVHPENASFPGHSWHWPERVDTSGLES